MAHLNSIMSMRKWLASLAQQIRLRFSHYPSLPINHPQSVAQVTAQREGLPQLTAILSQVQFTHRHAMLGQAQLNLVMDAARRVASNDLDRDAARHGPKAAACRQWHIINGFQGLQNFPRKCEPAIVTYGKAQLAQ